MDAVQIVTIKSKIPIFKGEEEAGRIELIQLEENGFDLISQKDLYQVGNKAVYIQPDYNLSDISLFESFLRPEGNESKSMLGKVNGVAVRIRAKKFNFHKGDAQPIYSNGILLPVTEVINFLNENTNKFFNRESFITSNFDLTEALGITKYEEPETDKNGMKLGNTRPFPEGVYKTDETNINNLWNHIEKNIGYPIRLIGTEKVDGSSITIGCKNNKGFICSRNLEKPLVVKKHVGRRNKTLLEKILFWKTPDLNLYKEVVNEDDFVTYGKPILNALMNDDIYRHGVVLRGELNGGSLKGSGNKNNPASKESSNIKIFGVDCINEVGIAERVDYDGFLKVTSKLNLRTVQEIFNSEFNSREEIEQYCNSYFKDNLIEGIVVRTPDGRFSAKFMNNEYDSKK